MQDDDDDLGTERGQGANASRSRPGRRAHLKALDEQNEEEEKQAERELKLKQLDEQIDVLDRQRADHKAHVASALDLTRSALQSLLALFSHQECKHGQTHCQTHLTPLPCPVVEARKVLKDGEND